MFCPKCGKEIPDNSKFCKYCGKSIRKSDNIQRKNGNEKSKADKNQKYLIGAIAVGAVVLVILLIVAVGGFSLFGGDDSDSNALSNGSASENNTPLSLSAFPVSEAPALASAVYSSADNYPVEFRSLSLSKAQCAYILTKSISEIASGNAGATIDVGSPAYAGNPSGYDLSQTINSAQYTDMSDRFSSWIERNGDVPNYIGINTGGVPDISPTKMIDISCRVLMQYDSAGQLPATVSV